jgi:DNA-binding PadR family transcriptional regulator
MSLRFVILGLLVEQPQHGYAIQAALEEGFDDLCDPGPGEVYRVLGALSRDGLVSPSTTRIGRRPRRKVYAPTAAGKRRLHAWLRDGGDGGRPPRDAPWLRMLVASRVAPALLAPLLDAEVEHRRSQLREIVAQQPARRAAPDFPALVRALRAASVRDAACSALRSAELCRRTVARHRDGAAVAELLRELARDEPPTEPRPGARSRRGGPTG